MAMPQGRFCVFCGKPPSDKTKEHVIPEWAIEMTGDPTRTVTFGVDFSKGQKPIRYSWSNYVAPACDPCNNKFSRLEDRIKPKVEALLRREALSVADYVELLDWLDKVRVGIWFIRHMIEKFPATVTPHFHIESRIAQKDRMLAVYVFDGQPKGINMFGSDSMLFNDMPSCFGLRVNDLLLLNASADFLCSAGCGFPYPATIRFKMGGDAHGRMVLQDFRPSGETHNPITRLRLLKPVVWLYQPIAMPSPDPIFQGGFQGHFNLFDSRLAQRMLEGSNRQGALFRQFADRVEMHRALSDTIAFDEVTGKDVAMLKDIAASIYEAQLFMFEFVKTDWDMPAEERKFEKAYRKTKLKNAEQLARMYRSGAITPGASPAKPGA
jgi:hypothetical protein